MAAAPVVESLTIVDTARVVAAAPVVAEAPVVAPVATKPSAPVLPEIGRPEDVGLVQVATQVKAFEPVELPLDNGATRRRRSDAKPAEAAPVQGELVMVETSHTPSQTTSQ
jgi:ribonuclease E